MEEEFAGNGVKPLRSRVRRLLASTLYRVGANPLYLRVRLKDKALVLMYHRVVDLPEGCTDPGMYVTRLTLEVPMHFLARHFQMVSLDDLRAWVAGMREFDKPPCTVTFDDGWADNYSVAFPILKAFGVPATVFLITDQIGSPDMLTWEQAREMERAGISFGSHTASHATLTSVDKSRVHDEVQRSRQRLTRELVRPSNWFCYPKGCHNAETREIVKQYFDGALTVDPGPVRQGDDLFTLHRIGIHNDIASTIPLFSFRLAQ